MNLLPRRIFGLLLASAGVGQGQTVTATGTSSSVRTAEQIKQLVLNTRKLQVTVEMDRQVYFPGEDAEIKITVANVSPTVLEVLQPFDIQTGGVDLSTYYDSSKPKADPRSWRGRLSERLGGFGVWAPNAPTVWIGPMQKLEMKYANSDPTSYSATDSVGRKIASVCNDCMMTEEEGEHRLCYSYGPGACADFSVVWPVLEQWAEVVLAKPLQYEEVLPNGKHTGQTRTVPRRVRAMVLGYQGTHVLAVGARAVALGARIDFDPSGKLAGGVNRYFGIHRRLVTSTVPITALQLTADTGENITIDYTDQSGKHYTLKLNANHQLLP